MLENLRKLPQEFQQFLFDVSQNRTLSDTFTDNFNYPERQWDCFASPARMRAWCDDHRTARPAVAAPSASARSVEERAVEHA
jgi:styrene monooxygenase